MLINVCVCTYKRDKLLSECLKSLSAMALPSDCTVKLLVIDNDAAMSARKTVEAIQTATAMEIDYAVEKKRGIPCARNRAIDISSSLGADLLVFVDDDEVVDTNWLQALYAVSGEYAHQAVIHGAVRSKLDPSVPESIAALFSTRERTERQELTACATDNVMVPMKFVIQNQLRFDESKPLAGGTDTVFFTRANKLGLKIFHTNTASVTEFVPLSRTKLSWLMKRKFRAGLTDAWRKINRGRSRGGVMLSALFQVFGFLLKGLFYSLVFMPLKRNESFLRFAKALGLLMGCFGLVVDSYKVVDS